MNEEKQLRNNPIFVITIAVVVALLMAGFSTLSFYHSETRTKLLRIQANQLADESLETKAFVEDEGDVTIEELDNFLESTQNSVRSLDDATDYSSEELTDSALGL